MGTNVSLTPALEQFAQASVASGRYNNVSEVVRAALRLLQAQEDARAAFVRSLEAAVEQGRRDGFRTAEEVEHSAMAAVARVRNPPMPPGNASLTDHQARFVADVLATGRYQDTSDVVRDGLRLLERREAEDAAKLHRLRTAVAESEAALARGDYEDVESDAVQAWVMALAVPATD